MAVKYTSYFVYLTQNIGEMLPRIDEIFTCGPRGLIN